MLTQLKLLTQSVKGREYYHILKNSVVIGRNPDCDIHLEEGAVSRIHARISFDGNRFTLTDLRSSNGTFVNGVAVKTPVTIYDGDTIRFSDLDFLFQSDVSGAKRISPAEQNYSVGSAILDESRSRDSINFTSQIDFRYLDHFPLRSSSQQDLYDRLQVLQTRLNAMKSLMKNLGKVTTVEEFLPEFLQNVLKIFPQADLVSILETVPDSKTVKFRILNHSLREGFTESPVRIGHTIPQYVYGTEKAIVSDDPSCDPRFQSGSDDSVVRKNNYSAMAAPIFENTESRPAGVIMVECRTGTAKFTKNDLELLTSIAIQFAFYCENLRFQKVRRQEEKLEQEMELAHQVQRGFLPFKLPDYPGYSFFDHYRSAKFVGGDYYDFIRLPGNRLGVVLADVSGKGMPAALLMAKLSSEVHSALMFEENLPAAMKRINQVYCDAHWENRFITMVLLVIEPDNGKIHLFNAGHVIPILIHEGGELEPVGDGKQGFPIGIIGDAEYEEIPVLLQPRDALVLMSDGITDAMNEESESFGTVRVQKYLKRAGITDPETLGRGLIAKIEKFAGSASQTDDQCLVVIGRN